MTFILMVSTIVFADTKVKSTHRPIKTDLYTAVGIPKGEFRMGCSMEQGFYCGADEKPVHVVEISQDFYLMKSEVTQELYKSVMNNKNPSSFSKCGSNCPVENLSWHEAIEFANALSIQENLETCYQISPEGVVTWDKGFGCSGWRLPTEAEWEYAARGNKMQTYAGSNNIESVGWYIKNANTQTHPVCEKQVNPFDLCDMNGNVEEWVWDWYDATYFTEQSKKDKVLDPTGASGNKYKIVRGGHFADEEVNIHTSARSAAKPNKGNKHIGIRLCRSILE